MAAKSPQKILARGRPPPIQDPSSLRQIVQKLAWKTLPNPQKNTGKGQNPPLLSMPGFWMDMAVQPTHYLLFLKCWEICFESSFYFDLKIQYLKIKTPILSFDMILTLDRISDYLG